MSTHSFELLWGIWNPLGQIQMYPPPAKEVQLCIHPPWSSLAQVPTWHPLSSERSPQSSLWSQTFSWFTHFSLLHLNWEGRQGMGYFRQRVWLFSSDPSPQSSCPLQICQRGIHFLLRHWNFRVWSHWKSWHMDSISSDPSPQSSSPSHKKSWRRQTVLLHWNWDSEQYLPPGNRVGQFISSETSLQSLCPSQTSLPRIQCPDRHLNWSCLHL